MGPGGRSRRSFRLGTRLTGQTRGDTRPAQLEAKTPEASHSVDAGSSRDSRTRRAQPSGPTESVCVLRSPRDTLLLLKPILTHWRPSSRPHGHRGRSPRVRALHPQEAPRRRVGRGPGAGGQVGRRGPPAGSRAVIYELPGLARAEASGPDPARCARGGGAAQLQPPTARPRPSSGELVKRAHSSVLK